MSTKSASTSTADTSAADTADTAATIAQAWSFNDPDTSERRFTQLADAAFEQGELTAALELLTQVARAQGLSGRREDAARTLEAISAQHGDLPAVVRVRMWLEQGRLLNSSHQPVAARPLFERAWQLARAEQLDGLAVDAAHMVAITFLSEPGVAIRWNDQALALARASTQAPARRWLPSLLNNQGWTYFEQQDRERALALFEEALVLRREQANVQATRIAEWCVAKARRVLGHTERALEIQLRLLAEYSALGKVNGYVFEELGELYLILGQAELAGEYFAQAHAELGTDAELQRSEAPRLERMARLGGVPRRVAPREPQPPANALAKAE
jgi:tetratricopeptide (TPR) repeat protein